MHPVAEAACDNMAHTIDHKSAQARAKRQRNSNVSADADGPQIYSLSELVIPFPSDEVHQHLAKSYGEENLCNILEAAKTSPSTTICRVNLIKCTREELIHDLTEHFADEGDWAIEPHSIFRDVVVLRPKEGEKEEASSSTSPSQQPPLYTSRIPLTSPNHQDVQPSCPCDTPTFHRSVHWPEKHRVVICDCICGEAVLRGSDIFIKGILVAEQNIVKGEEVAVYADLKRGKKTLRGQALESYCGECVFLGLGKMQCNRSTIFREDKGLGVKMCRGQAKRAGRYLPPINGVLVEKMFVQNLPSILVGTALNPQPNDVILDMCAAPGGKTSHLASLTDNRALIVACDKSRRKMVSARTHFEVLGATCIVPLALNSTTNIIHAKNGKKALCVKEIIDNAEASEKDGLLNIKGFYPGSFDKILLDPPCSALGLRPRLTMSTQNLNDLWKISEYQKGFVDNAVALLKSGGVLTYSTCTFNCSENEEMVKYVLEKHTCMKLEPIDVGYGLPGLSNAGLNDDQRQCVRRFDPSDKDLDSMGFFVAKFVKQ